MQNPYSIGQFTDPPYEIHLTVRPLALTVEQFKRDIPKLATKLATWIEQAHRESERRQSDG